MFEANEIKEIKKLFLITNRLLLELIGLTGYDFNHLQTVRLILFLTKFCSTSCRLESDRDVFLKHYSKTG